MPAQVPFQIVTRATSRRAATEEIPETMVPSPSNHPALTRPASVEVASGASRPTTVDPQSPSRPVSVEVASGASRPTIIDPQSLSRPASAEVASGTSRPMTIDSQSPSDPANAAPLAKPLVHWTPALLPNQINEYAAATSECGQIKVFIQGVLLSLSGADVIPQALTAFITGGSLQDVANWADLHKLLAKYEQESQTSEDSEIFHRLKVFSELKEMILEVDSRSSGGAEGRTLHNAMNNFDLSEDHGDFTVDPPSFFDEAWAAYEERQAIVPANSFSIPALTANPLLPCTSLSCPMANNPHNQGKYLHNNVEKESDYTFGSSDPPAFVWEAHYRQRSMIATVEDNALIQAFVYHHYC